MDDLAGVQEWETREAFALFEKNDDGYISTQEQ